MRVEIEEMMDSLTLEETAELAESVDVVTIDEEIGKRILNKSLSKAGIDPKKVTVMPKKKRYKKWIKVAASIAAVFVLCSATAYATGLLDGLSGYFTGDIEQFEGKISKTIQVSGNKEYKVGVDGAIADENQCLFVVSIKGVSIKGKIKSMTSSMNEIFDDITICAKLKDGRAKEVETLCLERWGSQDDAYLITLTKTNLGLKSIQEVEKFEVNYKGITVDANVIQLGDTIPLYTKEKTSLQQVAMSSIGFYFLETSVGADEVQLIRKDGTLERIYGCSKLTSSVEEGNMVEGNYDARILNLEEYSGLQIDGINYYKNK